MNTAEVIPTNQAWSHRVEVMTHAISQFEGPIDALEVGTWYGEGSTQIWLENLKPGSTLTLIDPWRPYASDADLRDPSFNYGRMDAQVLEAYMSTILAVRRFENAHPGKIKVDILRADSERVLDRMRDGVFDFIYIDGDHKYASVKKNIHDAKRLAKRTYSMVCGDDLEVLPTPKLLELARQHRDRDHLRPENESVFHPGVMLAVHEEFEQVGMHNGFWWVLQRNGRFSVDGTQ